MRCWVTPMRPKSNQKDHRCLRCLTVVMLAALAIQAGFLSPSMSSVGAKADIPPSRHGLYQNPSGRPALVDLSLSDAESAWLATHPEITIAINQAWPPMDYVEPDGEPKGIGVGFIKALNARLGGRLKIVPLPWTEMVQGVKEKRIDALMDITPRPGPWWSSSWHPGPQGALGKKTPSDIEYRLLLKDRIFKKTLEQLFITIFTTKFTGRGLGMAVTLGIVRASDGAIFVKSAPGQGTTVRVFFPACPKED